MRSGGTEDPPEWFDDPHGQDPDADAGRDRRNDHGPRSESAGKGRDGPDPDPDLDAAYRDDEGDFGEPLDILGNAELTGHPELTPDAVPATLYRYAKAEGERLVADPVPIAIFEIAACSLAASDQWRIKPKLYDRWTQQARLWVCVVKPPGARGTDMLKAAFWPLVGREKELRRGFRREHAAWTARMEGLKGKELAEAKKNDPEPKQQRLLTNDATVEALSQLLEGENDGAKIGYFADELATFLDFGRYKTGKGGGGSRAAMLQAYDGGPQQIDRIMRGSVFVANWSVVVAGNIQPRKLAELGTDLASDGLFQRFIVVHAKEAEVYHDDDRPTDQAAGAAYRDVINALFALKPPLGADNKTLPCFLDVEGREVRRKLMQLVQRLQHDRTLPDIIREAASKWSGLSARLTLIFHLVEVAERQIRGEALEPRDMVGIRAETAAKAAALIRTVVLPNLLRLGFETLPDGKEQANARWIAEHILANKLQHITARDVGRAFRPLRGKLLEIAASMDVLSHAGWTLQTEARADGIRWKINPAVHTRFAAAAAAEKARRKAVRGLIKRKMTEL